MKERKELAERKTRLQEIFDETRALGDYNQFDSSHIDAAQSQARDDAREAVVKAFRAFHQRHAGRLRRKDLIDMFADAARNMS